MIQYFTITHEPGQEIIVRKLSPTPIIEKYLESRSIFTGKRESSPYPVFVVKAHSKLNAMQIYEDFVHIPATRAERISRYTD